MKPPAFQFYADDFLAGTATMTSAEVGAYIRLLCLQWSQGGFSANEVQRLKKNPWVFLGFENDAIEAVLEKFPAGDDGRHKNERLEAVRLKSEEYAEKQRNNGKKGGRPKKQETQKNPSLSLGLTQTEANGNPNKTSPVSSLQSPIDKQTKRGDGKPESVGQIEEFAMIHELPTEHAAPFFDYFASNGWKVGGKTAMKDWRAAFRNWCRNAKKMDRTAPDAAKLARIPDEYLNAF